MLQTYCRRGFTWKEVVVALVVLAIVVGVIISAIPNIRERSRRNACSNNLKEIGLGLHNFYNAQKYFPPSADLRGEGKIKTAGGWSFLFKLLPNMEYDTIYDSINPVDLKSTTIDPLTDSGVPLNQSRYGGLGIARDTGIGEFMCPSNPNQAFENLQPIPCSGTGHAVTNYKALGATSMESLLVSIDPDSPPPYGDKSKHPDGVLFPAESGLKIDDIKDGLANTIMLVETLDYKASTWIAGSDVNLVGMNKAPSYTQYKDQNTSFWAPLDFNGKFYRQATPGIQSLKTYMSFDFNPVQYMDHDENAKPTPAGKDVGTYPAGVGRTPAYGPSSGHPGIVNHLFCDGSVHSLRKDIDYAAYFFLITRDNGDKRSPADDE
jgi:type II secretory pathway pseudopilin PulG